MKCLIYLTIIFRIDLIYKIMNRYNLESWQRIRSSQLAVGDHHDRCRLVGEFLTVTPVSLIHLQINYSTI